MSRVPFAFEASTKPPRDGNKFALRFWANRHARLMEIIYSIVEATLLDTMNDWIRQPAFAESPAHAAPLLGRSTKLVPLPPPESGLPLSSTMTASKSVRLWLVSDATVSAISPWRL